MKKTAKLIEKLIRLANGDALPASSLKGAWFEQMQNDGILLATAHGSRKSFRASDGMTLRQYVASQFDIHDLEQTRCVLSDEDVSRASLVAATGDSKFLSRRTFKGFLVNSYQPVTAILNGQEIIILPAEGSFMFVADYQHFTIPQDVVVVGVENAENFRYIALQKYLFARYGRVLSVILKTKTKISSNGYNPYLINTSILEIWTWLVSPFMSMSIIATWVLNPLSLSQMIMIKGFLTVIQIDIMISCPNTVK
jgi:hypothetical protein